MFIKRARPRPSARTRETENDESAASSPFAQPMVGTEGGDEEEAGSVLNRTKAKKKGMRGGKKSQLSFGGDEDVSLLRRLGRQS